MPYDNSLDATLFSKSWENDGDRLTVSIRSYNNGQKKLQLSRESVNNQGELRFAKLGRMTKDEVEAVMPLMQEAIQNMQ
ncbi:MAG: hypothetical protein HQ594_02190 [Candidatus Omnitrophica bacterium]|nr:hypothetical protein [Candidatus Omnitrophota bacterium]